jgi:hypothetical protein
MFVTPGSARAYMTYVHRSGGTDDIRVLDSSVQFHLIDKRKLGSSALMNKYIHQFLTDEYFPV